MKILLAEDEKELSRAVTAILERAKYAVDAAYDGAEALALAENNAYDVMVFDIMMPKMDGIELLKRIRQTGNYTPVIMLTAKSEVDDRITGLDAGADDYLTKPYSMKELLSRVNALMRRAYGGTDEPCFTFGDVTVNTASRTVTKSGRPVALAQREYDLLVCLCRNKNTAVPKDKLLTEVWGAFSEVEPSTLTVHIRWLREKLEDDPAAPRYIRTVWKLGYMLGDET